MEIQWSLVIFTVLAGAGAWLSALIGLNEIKGDVKDTSTKFIAALVALALAVIGGIASVTHLSHPDRIMAALGHPTSGIFMEALFVGLLSVALIIYVIALKRGGSSSAGSAADPSAATAAATTNGAVRILGIAVGVLGIILAFVLGYSYMMAGRPAWNTILLPIGYFLTAAPLGAAAWIVLITRNKEADAAGFAGTAGTILTVFGVAAAIGALAYGFASGAATGDSATVFWLLVVICGGAVPAVCGFMVQRQPERGLALGASAFVVALIGCAAFRCLMWMVGAGIDNFFGLI